MTLSELDGMPILPAASAAVRARRVQQRLVDIAGSIAALVLFSPLMLLIALAVWLSGPGPVIFKQRRVSLGGETFKIWQVPNHTTSRMSARLAEQQAAAAGARARPSPAGPHATTGVTPVGRWLRKTSLDEIPQFLNVLAGQMSLSSGRAPERPELIERFRDDWRGYMLRQHVKAGITGWAQVRGIRGDTDLRKRLQHDLFYIRHWSLWFDAKILWLTLFRGFLHRNAH